MHNVNTLNIKNCQCLFYQKIIHLLLEVSVLNQHIANQHTAYKTNFYNSALDWILISSLKLNCLIIWLMPSNQTLHFAVASRQLFGNSNQLQSQDINRF